MAAPGSRAGSAVWPGALAGREATAEGERAASPGPELSPLEPGPSPLAAGEGSAEGSRSWQDLLSQLPGRLPWGKSGWPGNGSRRRGDR